MASPLMTPTVIVDVTAAEGKQTLHVHQAVLRQIPYFSAQEDRWASGPLSVKLPDGASLESLTAVLEKMYFPKKAPLDLNTSQALRIVQVASMLNCDQALLDNLVVGLRGTLGSEADAEMLVHFCEEHEAPPELVKLATRLKKPQAASKEFDDKEVETMFRNGLRHRDDDLLKLAETHLKKRSRRGGADLQKVAAIMATQAAESFGNSRGYALALEFTSKYPAMFRFMATKMFAPRTFHYGAHEYAPKYAIDFMEHGIAGVTTGIIDADDVVVLFNQLSQLGCLDERQQYRWLFGYAAPRDALAGLLSQTSGGVQLKVCKVLCASRQFTCLDHARLLSTLAVEAKELVADQIMRCPDGQLATVVTIGVLELLGDRAKPFCQKAHLFEGDVKTALVKSAMPEESDDGF